MQDKLIEYIVFDLETTGFVPPEAKVLEIGAMIKYEGQEELETKHWVLNHNIEIPEKIIEITGITKDIIDAEGKDPVESLNDFLPYLMASPKNITHNGIKFDIPFLVGHCVDILKWSEITKAEVEYHLKERAFDTAVHFKAKKIRYTQKPDESFLHFASRVMDVRVFGVKFNLGLCVQEEGIDTTDITFHRALGDVAMTHKLYQRIEGIKKINEALENEDRGVEEDGEIVYRDGSIESNPKGL